MSNNAVQKFSCYIFPDVVNGIDDVLKDNMLSFHCKVVNMEVESYRLREKLRTDYGIKDFNVHILDKNKVCVITSDYKKLDIPNITVKDKDVITTVKRELYLSAVLLLPRIDWEIKYRTNPNSSKKRNKEKLAGELRQIISNQFLCR